MVKFGHEKIVGNNHNIFLLHQKGYVYCSFKVLDVDEKILLVVKDFFMFIIQG